MTLSIFEKISMAAILACPQ